MNQDIFRKSTLFQLYGTEKSDFFSWKKVVLIPAEEDLLFIIL